MPPGLRFPLPPVFSRPNPATAKWKPRDSCTPTHFLRLKSAISLLPQKWHHSEKWAWGQSSASTFQCEEAGLLPPASAGKRFEGQEGAGRAVGIVARRSREVPRAQRTLGGPCGPALGPRKRLGRCVWLPRGRRPDLPFSSCSRSAPLRHLTPPRAGSPQSRASSLPS